MTELLLRFSSLFTLGMGMGLFLSCCCFCAELWDSPPGLPEALVWVISSVLHPSSPSVEDGGCDQGLAALLCQDIQCLYFLVRSRVKLSRPELLRFLLREVSGKEPGRSLRLQGEKPALGTPWELQAQTLGSNPQSRAAASCAGLHPQSEQQVMGGDPAPLLCSGETPLQF